MKDPRQSDAVVQVASNTKAGQLLASRFRVPAAGEAGDEVRAARTALRAAPSAAGRDAVRAAGWVRRLKLPIRWKSIAGTFWEASRWRWPREAVYIANRSRSASVPDFGAPMSG